MRARTATIGLALIALAACSGGGQAPAPVGPTAAAAPDAGAPVAVTPTVPVHKQPVDPPLAPPPPPISRDECGQLVDRMLAIELAEQRAGHPHDPQLAPAQTAALRERLLGQAEPVCASMSRAAWQCAVAAADRAAMTACDQAE